MASLPDSRIYLVVRTYFDDDAGWRALRRVIDKGSDEGVFATVEYVNDRQFDGFTSDALEAVHPYREEGWAVMYVADERAIREPSHPLLLVKVGSTEELPFRCRADRAPEVDANLSLANLDWNDLRDQVDESGIYGGVETVRVAPHIDPAVAAHKSASAEPLTISVPRGIFWELNEDLFEADLTATGPGYRQVRSVAGKIRKRFREGAIVSNRSSPEADVVVTLPTRDWAFVLERARQNRSLHGNHVDADNGRQRGVEAGHILDVISPHLP